MRYVFMNKNTPLLDCEINPNTGHILHINNILNHDYFPVSLLNAKDDELEKWLHDWWSRRRIPASRQNLTWALQNVNISDTRELLIKSLG